MFTHSIGEEGPAIVFGLLCQLTLGRIIPNIEETISSPFASFFGDTSKGLFKPSPLQVTDIILKFGEGTVHLSHETGKVLFSLGNHGHMDMVGHRTEPQNLDIVTGCDRANRSKPDQIVALAVEKEPVVGRSLVAVVQDATFKSAVLHRYVNCPLQGSSTIEHPKPQDKNGYFLLILQ